MRQSDGGSEHDDSVGEYELRIAGPDLERAQYVKRTAAIIFIGTGGCLYVGPSYLYRGVVTCDVNIMETMEK